MLSLLDIQKAEDFKNQLDELHQQANKSIQLEINADGNLKPADSLRKMHANATKRNFHYL